MALSKNDKEALLNHTKEKIYKESQSLIMETEVDTLIHTANLAIQRIIGTIAQEDKETLSEAVEMAQNEAWGILSNTQILVSLYHLASECFLLEVDLK